MAGRARRRQRGASLLEALTATAILATVMGLGIPNLISMRDPYVISSAAQQIAADLQLARQRAIARNTRYQVKFDTTAATYTLERETTANSFVVDGGVQKLPRGVALGSVTPGDPIFDTRGMLATGVSIALTTAGGRARTVTANVLGRTAIN
jgi:Tfp pilus assembly protein FimT